MSDETCNSVVKLKGRAMDRQEQKREIDLNYDVFVRCLAKILSSHRGEYALMRRGEIIDYFASPGAANVAGVQRFDDGLFTIQEVTDEPIDLGFWSHVATH